MANILIVDDDPQATELIHDLLDYYGYVSATCSDASCAMLMVELDRPQLVFLDLSLPGKADGWQLFKDIRQIAPSTICIAITAYDSTAVERSARQMGFNDYFSKPVDPLHLAHAVEKIGSAKKMRHS